MCMYMCMCLYIYVCVYVCMCVCVCVCGVLLLDIGHVDKHDMQCIHIYMCVCVYTAAGCRLSWAQIAGRFSDHLWPEHDVRDEPPQVPIHLIPGRRNCCSIA